MVYFVLFGKTKGISVALILEYYIKYLKNITENVWYIKSFLY